MNPTPSNRYDLTKGWDGTSPGWHEVVLYVSDPRDTIIRYEQTLEWIAENIHGYMKHSRWMYAGNYLKYKFRYERDYLWFKIRWG